MLRTIKFLTTLLVTGTMFVSCGKNDDTPAQTNANFRATLSGTQEVPTNSTIASGTFTSTFNATTKVLTYTVTYTGLTPTAWHLHKGAVGVIGGVEVSLGTTFTSPYSSTAVLTTAQEADLNNGLLYVNIHSAIFPDGEIRGQLTKQ